MPRLFADTVDEEFGRVRPGHAPFNVVGDSVNVFSSDDVVTCRTEKMKNCLFGKLCKQHTVIVRSYNGHLGNYAQYTVEPGY